MERRFDRASDRAYCRSSRQKSARRRAPLLRRDYRQSHLDPAIRFDGAAREGPRSRAAAQRARPFGCSQQARAARVGDAPAKRRGSSVIRAIVLAAGKGTRMKSARSKVLHEICGRPMLWFVVEALRRAGIADILVVTNAELQERLGDLC